MTSWWSAEPYLVPFGPGALRQGLLEDGFLFDLSDERTLARLRGDVARVARAMEEGTSAPPMYWTGIPFPAAPRALEDTGWCLSVSVGGTKTEYGLLRLKAGQLCILDAAGVERTGPVETLQAKRNLRVATPTQLDARDGEEMLERIVQPIAAYLEPHKARLGGRLEIVLSWGFAHSAVRTGPQVLGGLTALTTLMTKEQSSFTKYFEGRSVGQLVVQSLEKRLSWSFSITVANDGIMALHYFLDDRSLRRYARLGLFINGTGTNFAAAERYAVRAEGVVSKAGERYQPRRLRRGESAGPGEREELYFVNYETGSLPLDATKTRYDVSSEYPIESNALSGGHAFEQQLRGVITERVSPTLHAELVAARRAAGLGDGIPRGPEVAQLATRGVEAIPQVFPGIELSASTCEDLVFIARAIELRSALHAAIILAAVTERTGFGHGVSGKPDCLAMEGSVWSTHGYPELVWSAWQVLSSSRPLRVDMRSEPGYNASLPGPLYFAAIHGP